MIIDVGLLRRHHLSQTIICMKELAYRLRDEPRFSKRLVDAVKHLDSIHLLLQAISEEYGDTLKVTSAR